MTQRDWMYAPLVLVERPTIVLRCLQKLMSFLNAKKSKSSCKIIERGEEGEGGREVRREGGESE